METSLISSDMQWLILAILFSTAAFALWAETTRWGARLSGAVIAIATTFTLSNLGLIPVSAPAYDRSGVATFVGTAVGYWLGA